MNKEDALKKINENPIILDELKWGGTFLFCRISGTIFHCCSDEKTYYQKWNEETEKFELIEWRCGGLNNYNLEIISRDDLICGKVQDEKI